MQDHATETDAIHAGMRFYSWLTCRERLKYFPSERMASVRSFLGGRGVAWEEMETRFENSWDWRSRFRAIAVDVTGECIEDKDRLAQCFELGIRAMEFNAVFDGGGLGCLKLINQLREEFLACIRHCGATENAVGRLHEVFAQLLESEGDTDGERAIAAQLAAMLRPEQ